MFSVYRTLSLRYLQRRWFLSLLIVASIALGVATLVATLALNDTMSKGAVASNNPMAGLADFLVSNGDFTISRLLVSELQKVVGVKSVQARIFRSAYLPKYDKRVLVMGIDLVNSGNDLRDQSDKDAILFGAKTRANYTAAAVAQRLFVGIRPAVVGKALADEIKEDEKQSTFLSKFVLDLKKNALDKEEETQSLVPIPFIDGTGVYSFLGGYVLLLDLSDAAAVFDMKEDQVHRIDIALEATADHDKVRKELEKCLNGRASLKTPDEQNQSLQSVMSGMRTGFSLNGVAALVVGIFLMYSVLAFTVAERRHEIGILLSVGATRGQVHRLFAGEAGVLGLVGSLLGLPLGWSLAALALGPMQGIVEEIFNKVQVRNVELAPALLIFAACIGVATAVLAGLIPAMLATRESPAEAVRRVAKAVTLRHLIALIVISVTMSLIGALLILLREFIPYRVGTYGGLMLVLLGALVASPFFAAMFSRLFQPLARSVLSIEWRLAADNLVRSPGRTGLVIGFLAAGVALFVQTAGAIRSNRQALRDWVQDTFAADLIVWAGGPVSVGQGLEMDETVGAALRKEVPQIEEVLPTRAIKVPFRDTNVYLCAIEAGKVAVMERKRLAKSEFADLARVLEERPDTVVVSENFAILYHVRKGDTLTLLAENGPVHLEVIGQVVDYSWNHGSLTINRREFKKYWPNDKDKVNSYDVYVYKGEDIVAVRDVINKRLGAQHKLHSQTCAELQTQIDDMIQSLYGIAFAQQVVVMVVALLGVIMALLISVLQRRRELGLLRAIGATRGQIIYSVLAEACLMGIIGTIIGLLVGVPLQWYVLRVVFLEESGYLFPVYIPWLGGLIIASAAMGVATLAGLGPAAHSVRMRIPEAIAYE